MLGRIVRWVGLALLGLLAVGFGLVQVWARSAPQPESLGAPGGELTPCPTTPNCVTTQRGLPSQQMSPFSYSGPQAVAQARLVRLIEAAARATIVTEQPGYLHAIFESRVFGFIDDVEFVFDDARKLVHFRAAARLGHNDGGANRTRMEQLRQAFS